MCRRIHNGPKAENVIILIARRGRRRLGGSIADAAVTHGNFSFCCENVSYSFIHKFMRGYNGFRQFGVLVEVDYSQQRYFEFLT